VRPFLAAIVCCYLLAPVAMAEEFPYRAVIDADDVYVRSGPGASYYPTDKLKAGQVVEVWRHDPGGWLAIRPPKGSFSWVSARFLEPAVDGLAVCTHDRIAARVGSRFSSIRDVIQVRLNAAETVEVLGEKAPGTASDAREWYKIAPPSGEFRWVHGKYTHRQDGARTAASSPAAKGGEADPATVPRDSSLEQDIEPVGPVAVRHSHPESNYQPAAAGPFAAGSPATGASNDQVLTPEAFRRQLEAIELGLSTMVAEEPTVWTFDEMRERTLILMDRAPTAVQRGLARAVVNKMARFEDIKLRHDQVATLATTGRPPPARPSATEPDAAPRDTQPRTARSPSTSSPFDGAGRLTRVVSSKVGAPRYALVDDRGEVQCYVSPAPGVSLNHYVGRRVGVTGSRGYMPEQRAHHVMARHVNLLQPTWR